ncbi:hypothetical protein WA026_009790 [Henosepilachna vigintioctopunctata]|uniref:Uncharacterized protein n=1 Tax=Henosepilachna vigintioctopunctata TaxID=420089 RepID=A0AAW1TRY9_9CUCU
MGNLRSLIPEHFFQLSRCHESKENVQKIPSTFIESFILFKPPSRLNSGILISEIISHAAKTMRFSVVLAPGPRSSECYDKGVPKVIC